MLEKLKQVNWVLFVLISLGLRSVWSADISQALVVTAFSGLYAFKMYLNSREIQSADKDVKKQIEEVQATVAGLAMKNAIKPQQMQQEINKRFF